MALFFSDFSRIQFSNITGPSLPRKQRVRMEDFDGSVVGDELVIRSTNVGMQYPSTDSVISSPWTTGTTIFRMTSGWEAQGARAEPLEIYWTSDEGTVDGVDILANYPGQGSWRRSKYSGFHAARTRVIGDGSADDTAAFENALKVAAKKAADRGYGNYFEIPTGWQVKLTDTIHVSSSDFANDFSIIGQRHGKPTGQFNSRFLWHGADDRPAFALSSFGAAMRGVWVGAAPGRTLATCFDIQYQSAYSGNYVFEGCTTGDCGGTTQRGITTDYFRVGTYDGNLEEVRIIDCKIAAQNECLRLDYGQPYAWYVMNCILKAEDVVLVPTGVGIMTNTLSSGVNLHNINFGVLSVCLGIDFVEQLVMSGRNESENAKTFIRKSDGSLVTSGSANVTTPNVYIHGMRWAGSSYARASANPTISSDDRVLINNVATLTMDNCDFRSSAYTHAPRQTIYGPRSMSVNIRSCSFPNCRPVERAGSLYGGRQGEVRLENCFGLRGTYDTGETGSVWKNISTLGGTSAPDTITCVIPSDATDADVAWEWEENIAPLVEVDVQPESGTPVAAALTATVVESDASRALIRLGAAPGGTATVRATVKIRPRIDSAPKYYGAKNFVPAAVTGTAAGGGFGNVVWVSLLVRVNRQATGGGQYLFLKQGAADGLLASTVAANFFGIGVAGVEYVGTFATQAADVGKTHLVTMTFGAGVFGKAYLNQGGSQTGTVFTGIPNCTHAANFLSIGSDNAGAGSLSDFTILGLAYGSSGTRPADADVSAYCDAIALQGTLPDFPGTGIVTTQRWIRNAAGTWVDAKGAGDMTQVAGAAPETEVVVPSFAWVV